MSDIGVNERYQYRMVHFYQEVTPEELYQICTSNLNDITSVQSAYRQWLRVNPYKVGQGL